MSTDHDELNDDQLLDENIEDNDQSETFSMSESILEEPADQISSKELEEIEIPPELQADGTLHTPGTMIPEVSESYLNYAMSVIISRALPAVQDGLKPVHRRILYGMRDLNATHSGGFRKSSRCVGNILGKFHPHGESSVYNALVKLVQPFSIRYPLVTGHGNFGSEDGDPAAAQRYTNCKLSRLSDYLLENVENVVRMVDNFDGTEKEPEYLPAKFPNILINGTQGIAVGFATSMPPHNLREICQAVQHRMYNPRCSLDDLLMYVKGPDFPNGGIIINPEAMRSIYHRGRGTIRIAARCRTDEAKKELIFSDIPPRIQKPALIEEILKRANEGKILDLVDLADESSRGEQRLRCRFTADADLTVVRNQLYHYTSLTTTFPVLNNVLIQHKPVCAGLILLIDEFIRFRIQILRNLLRYEIRRLKEQLFILDGMVIALQNIDEVIRIIRTNERTRVQTLLQTTFDLRPRQIEAILGMRLSRLSRTESSEVILKQTQTRAELEQKETIIRSSELQKEQISIELDEIIRLEGDERRTSFEQRDPITERALIKNISEILIVGDNTIRREPLSQYRLQKRSGKGLALAGKEFETGKQILPIETLSQLFLFSRSGKVFDVRGTDIPRLKNKYAKPHSISSIIGIDPSDTIISSLVVNPTDLERNVVLCSRLGKIKRLEAQALQTRLRAGKIAIRLGPQDTLLDSQLIDPELGNICIFTQQGRIVIYPLQTVPLLSSLGTMGVNAIQLANDDQIEGFLTLSEGTGRYLLSISSQGFGKITPVEMFPTRITRPSVGVLAMRIDQTTGKLVQILAVERAQEIMILTREGKTIRFNTSTIRMISRVTKGVRLIELEPTDQIVRAVVLEQGEQDV